MTTGMKTVIHPVKDLATARDLYRVLLGVDPVMDEPYYVGFDVGDQHVGLDPHGHAKGMTGAVGYWHVDDVEKTITQLTAAGATVSQSAADVGGGKLVAVLADTEGHPIGLIQAP